MSGPKSRRLTEQQVEDAKRAVRAGWTVAQRRASVANYEQAYVTAVEDALDGMQNAIEFLRTNTEEYRTDENTEGITDQVWMEADQV